MQKLLSSDYVYQIKIFGVYSNNLTAVRKYVPFLPPPPLPRHQSDLSPPDGKVVDKDHSAWGRDNLSAGTGFISDIFDSFTKLEIQEFY